MIDFVYLFSSGVVDFVATYLPIGFGFVLRLGICFIPIAFIGLVLWTIHYHLIVKHYSNLEKE